MSDIEICIQKDCVHYRVCNIRFNIHAIAMGFAGDTSILIQAMCGRSFRIEKDLEDDIEHSIFKQSKDLILTYAIH